MGLQHRYLLIVEQRAMRVLRHSAGRLDRVSRAAYREEARETVARL
jgi:hypothetical protein